MERAARSGAKQRARAAATIQQVWRGHRARRRLREVLVADWAATYGALVSAPESRISGQDVAGGGTSSQGRGLGKGRLEG